MRVLITGGTGLIGRYTAQHLAMHGVAVRVLSRRANPDVPMLRGLPGVEYAVGDVRQPESLAAAMIGCQAAVLSHQFPRFPIEDPKRGHTFDLIDRIGTQHAVAAAQAAGVSRLVYLSGAALGSPNPDHPGVRAKLAAEQTVLSSAISGLCLRASVVYAVDDKYFAQLAGLSRRFPWVPLFAGGRAMIQPITADEIAAVVRAAIDQPAVTGVIYAGGPEAMNWRQFLLLLTREASGWRHIGLPVPQALLNIAGLIGERFDPPLITRAAINFIGFENACPGVNCDSALGVALAPVRDSVRRLFAPR